MTTTQSRTIDRPVAATAVGVLAALGVVGSILMSIAHFDLGIPVISTLGPQGKAIVPVAIGFAVGAVLFAVVAYGALTRVSWAWPVALVVNALAFVSAVLPWRGLDRSGLPALITLAALVLLASRPGREALLYPHRDPRSV